MTTQDIITAWNNGITDLILLKNSTGYGPFTIIQTLNSSIPGFRNNFTPVLDDYEFNIAINSVLIGGTWYYSK